MNTRDADTFTFTTWLEAVDAGIENGAGYTAVRDGENIRLTLPCADGEISHLWESWYAQWLHENVRSVLRLIGESITRVECEMTVRHEDHEDVRWFDCIMYADGKLDETQLDYLESVDFVVTDEGWGVAFVKDDVTIEVLIG